MNSAKHPATFSDDILKVIAGICIDYGIKEALDPFAGTGKVHQLGRYGVATWGIELEQEWADMHPATQKGNALALPFSGGQFQAVITSPAYGNRLADHYEPKDGSHRRNYRQYLGRALSDDNSGKLQWGAGYRDFHRLAWTEARRILRDRGLLVLNISNHIRNKKVAPVTEWHVGCLADLGFFVLEWNKVETPRYRYGENWKARVSHESVIVFEKIP